MNRRQLISGITLGLLAVPLLTSGCALSIELDPSQLRAVTPPPASVRALTIDVDTPVPDIEGDQATLLAALRKEFSALGYRMESGSLALKATITRLERGNTLLMIGLGIGRDVIDVAVALGDATGTQYMTFVVRGEAIDKRYADIIDVIRGIAKKIADEVRTASR